MQSKTYFDKHAFCGRIIKESPEPELQMVIVIPCYHENQIEKSLLALKRSKRPQGSTEIIVVVNDGENTPPEIIAFNDQTYQELIHLKTSFDGSGLKLLPIRTTRLPAKKAGVGLARKIGMDEAARRLPSNGIIVGFDADTTCADNYLFAVEQHFIDFPKVNGCSIHFEHPIAGKEFSQEIYQGIIQYELHLRFFMDAQKNLMLPYAFQTIGSSMAVRNLSYKGLGGMNVRKAGEDFYFLQKIIKNTNFNNCTTTKVFPSPRISTRVPFGTGRAISEMQIRGKSIYLTYHPDAYKEIEDFISFLPAFYQNKTSYSGLLSAFLEQQKFKNRIEEIRQQTKDYASFNKRFFRWFDAFLLMKSLHFLRDHYFPNIPVEKAVDLAYPKLENYTAGEKLIFFRNKVL